MQFSVNRDMGLIGPDRAMFSRTVHNVSDMGPPAQRDAQNALYREKTSFIFCLLGSWELRVSRFAGRIARNSTYGRGGSEFTLVRPDISTSFATRCFLPRYGCSELLDGECARKAAMFATGGAVPG